MSDQRNPHIRFGKRTTSKAVEPTAPAKEGVSPFMPAAAERAAGRGQPGRRQEAGRAAEAARARAVRGLLMMERKSYPVGMRCFPSWLRTWGPLPSKASKSLTA